MTKFKILIVLLFVNITAMAASDISSNIKSKLVKDNGDLENIDINKRRRKKSPMPNLFIGAGINSYMIRLDGMGSWSGMAQYNHDLFSLSLSSCFSLNLFPYEDDNDPTRVNYNQTFNITQGIGTIFFHSYTNQTWFRAYTGEYAYVPLGTIIYYKKQTVSRENKLGARIGFMHHKENVVDFLALDKKTPEGFDITSYSVNSLIVGLSKTSFCYTRYRNLIYIHNGNLYFDLMLKLKGSEIYRLHDETTNTYTYYEDLNIFDYRLGWRIGFDKRAKNCPFAFLNYTQGVELGMFPVPKYGSVSGLYLMVKFGLMFNSKVG